MHCIRRAHEHPFSHEERASRDTQAHSKQARLQKQAQRSDEERARIQESVSVSQRFQSDMYGLHKRGCDVMVELNDGRTGVVAFVVLTIPANTARAEACGQHTEMCFKLRIVHPLQTLPLEVGKLLQHGQDHGEGAY